MAPPVGMPRPSGTPPTLGIVALERAFRELAKATSPALAQLVRRPSTSPCASGASSSAPATTPCAERGTSSGPCCCRSAAEPAASPAPVASRSCRTSSWPRRRGRSPRRRRSTPGASTMGRPTRGSATATPGLRRRVARSRGGLPARARAPEAAHARARQGRARTARARHAQRAGGRVATHSRCLRAHSERVQADAHSAGGACGERVARGTGARYAGAERSSLARLAHALVRRRAGARSLRCAPSGAARGRERTAANERSVAGTRGDGTGRKAQARGWAQSTRRGPNSANFAPPNSGLFLGPGQVRADLKLRTPPTANGQKRWPQIPLQALGSISAGNRSKIGRLRAVCCLNSAKPKRNALRPVILRQLRANLGRVRFRTVLFGTMLERCRPHSGDVGQIFHGTASVEIEQI